MGGRLVRVVVRGGDDGPARWGVRVAVKGRAHLGCDLIWLEHVRRAYSFVLPHLPYIQSAALALRSPSPSRLNHLCKSLVFFL